MGLAAWIDVSFVGLCGLAEFDWQCLVRCQILVAHLATLLGLNLSCGYRA